MKKMTFIMIFFSIFIIACIAHKKNTVLQLMSDKYYLKYYRPFICISIKMYDNDISNEKILKLKFNISKMDDDIIYFKKVEIYESILLILDIKIENIKINEISKEDALLALNSLEFLIKKYENSPLIIEMYQKLKKDLQLFA